MNYIYQVILSIRSVLCHGLSPLRVFSHMALACSFVAPDNFVTLTLKLKLNRGGFWLSWRSLYLG